MRRATAVIGANYGDEGKGLVVDALCENGPDTVVVRFNGGAQAGHTVVTPDGRRHVFHHHGAGTFRGAATYLSERFILNPLLFRKEHLWLGKPRVMASPQACVTTPYDMMLNQWAEEDRGQARHGSCGIGINETVERCATEYGTNGISISGRTLRWIVEEYVESRAAQLGVRLTADRRDLLRSNGIADNYLEACEFMKQVVDWRNAEDVDADVILFEGAQGLLLDEFAHDFPYVTRSRTGLANVWPICHQMGIPFIDAVFVTRTYLTRHGAGPMPGEDPAMHFEDATNVRNDWQHGLRFAALNVPSLWARIETEVAREAKRGSMIIFASIAMTCADQLPNPELRSLSRYESSGPTRLTFQRLAGV